LELFFERPAFATTAKPVKTGLVEPQDMYDCDNGQSVKADGPKFSSDNAHLERSSTFFDGDFP